MRHLHALSWSHKPAPSNGTGTYVCFQRSQLFPIKMPPYVSLPFLTLT